mgnify:FL=1
MANKIIAADPEQHGAAPVKGNDTTDAETHMWCAEALARVVACQDATFAELPADVQDALRHLLMNEMTRAKQARADEPMLGSVHRLQAA